MASEVTELLVALRAWQKAVQQLKHSGTTAAERQQVLEAAQQQVLSQLAKSSVEAEIDALIQAAATASGATDELRSRLRQDPAPFVSTELDSIHPMGVSHNTFQQVIADYLRSPNAAHPLDDSQQILKMFTALNDAVLTEHEATVALSRKPKKRRRRDLSLGTLQTAIGIGLVAGNTQMDSTIANSSYILGGNALLTALQNFVGRIEEIVEPKPPTT
jgi:ATP-dependent Clp protease ATP-binding subunit ClpA